jgi:ribonuclease HII
MKYSVGVDEAGRGPVIGPMFLAICIIEKCQNIEKILIKDSKAFGSSKNAKIKREKLALEIISSLQSFWIEIPAHVIDRYILEGPGLNQLERDAAEYLLKSAPHNSQIIADGYNLFNPLIEKFPNLLALNKADAKHKIVGAASIVAKNARDTWFSNYEKRIFFETGIIIKGGGYPNKNTKEFISKYKNLLKQDPPCLRKSWKLTSPVKQLALKL